MVIEVQLLYIAGLFKYRETGFVIFHWAWIKSPKSWAQNLRLELCHELAHVQETLTFPKSLVAHLV
jgi:hypothetical protein